MKIGDKVVCITRSTTGPIIQPDRHVKYVVTAFKAASRTGMGRATLCLQGKAGYVWADEFKRVELTIPEMEKEIKEIYDTADTKITTLKNRVSYMQHTGSREFDETEFKVFSTLQELKKSNDDLAKAKAIAKLISD